MKGGAPDPADLLAALGEFGPIRVLYVAYSGGADSHALLHLLACRRSEALFELRAVHVNHNLQPGSDHWAAHCERVCNGLGVPLEIVDVQPDGGSNREARAREARYAAWEALLHEGDAVCTAHHRDDQAETLLLRLLRGAGVDGLAAMPASRALGAGRLLRPLLGVGRADLRRYGRAQGLDFIEDPSNSELSQDRNFLRHRVMPVLAERWPDASASLARVTEAARESRSLGEDLARLDGLPDGPRLDCARLWALPGRRRRNLVRAWLRSLALRPPGRLRLNQGLRDLLHAAEDRRPELRWPDGRIRRYREWLYADDGMDPPPLSAPRPWHGEARMLLPSGVLHARNVLGEGVSCALLEAAPITVDCLQPGERCRPSGRPERPVKKLMQEAAIPPWQRRHWPVLRLHGRIVAIPGICIGEGCRPPAGGGGLELRYEPRG